MTNKKKVDRVESGIAALMGGNALKSPTVAENGVEAVKQDVNAGKAPMPIAPFIPTMMTIPVEHIHFFEDNPRLGRNPKHDQIKESIRASGVTQVVQVTKRPHNDFFVISAGGNTRLTIVKELLQEGIETNNEDLIQRFSNLEVKFSPYIDEVTLVAQHYQENELKALSAFIDNAIAYDKAVLLIEEKRKNKAEADGDKYKPLSMADMADNLKSVGMKVTRQILPVYLFAVEIMKNFTHAYALGMGRKSTEKIRESHNRFLAWIEAKGLSDLQEELISNYYSEIAKFDQPREEIPLHEEINKICEEAMIAVGVSLGEENIEEELRNLYRYKSLVAPDDEKDNAETNDSPVQAPESANEKTANAPVVEDATAPIQNDVVAAPKENEAVTASNDDVIETTPTHEDVAPRGQEKDVAQQPEKNDVEAVSNNDEVVADSIQDDIAPVVIIEEEVEQVANNDIEADLAVQSLYDVVDSNILLKECFVVKPDDVDSNGLVHIVGDLYFNAFTAMKVTETDLLSEGEFGQLVTGYNLLGELLLTSIKNSANDNEKTKNNKNAALIWYISTLSIDVNSAVVTVSNLLSHILTKSEDVNVLEAIYLNAFVDKGMDSIDYQEFLSEYFSVVQLVQSLLNK